MVIVALCSLRDDGAGDQLKLLSSSTCSGSHTAFLVGSEFALSVELVCKGAADLFMTNEDEQDSTQWTSSTRLHSYQLFRRECLQSFAATTFYGIVCRFSNLS